VSSQVKTFLLSHSQPALAMKTLRRQGLVWDGAALATNPYPDKPNTCHAEYLSC